MGRLIDADELKKPVGSYNPVKFTWEYGDVISVEDIDNAPTVETDTVNAAVCVDYEALMEPWCEQYVKSEIARGIAHELVERIEIRSFDSDIHRMMKEFRARVVIVKGAMMDGDENG